MGRLNPGFFRGVAFFAAAFALLYALPFLPLKKEGMRIKMSRCGDLAIISGPQAL
jgi:hypothetical protein